MSRCVVCNTPLKPEEIVWKPEIGEHESFCYACLCRHVTEDDESVPVWDDDEHES
jgi:hypothetical protein